VSDNTKYNQRGVSAGKEEVHQAIKHLSKGLYPNAFCKILPDIVANDEAYVNIMHADTAGTKTALAYLYWKETGDINIWKGIVQDAIVMNVDDMACVGVVNDIMLSSTIGRNKHLITGEVISAIINGAHEFCESLKPYGINIHLTGGETADVGDIVRTIDVGYTTFARLAKNSLIVNDIRDGDVIVGISSSGKASYENAYNSGIGSNGLTSARHDVLNKYYDKSFEEVVDPNTDESVRFTGSRRLTDTYLDYSVGDLLLSPTRTYLPVLQKIFAAIEKEHLHGIIHCTGGGQTKVLHFVNNVHIIKDNLFELPPVFKMIQQESGTDYKELYQVFNMGHRLELYVNPQIAKSIIEIAQSFNIDAKVIGKVLGGTGSQLTIDGEFGVYEYSG